MNCRFSCLAQYLVPLFPGTGELSSTVVGAPRAQFLESLRRWEFVAENFGLITEERLFRQSLGINNSRNRKCISSRVGRFFQWFSAWPPARWFQCLAGTSLVCFEKAIVCRTLLWNSYFDPGCGIIWNKHSSVEGSSWFVLFGETQC